MLPLNVRPAALPWGGNRYWRLFAFCKRCGAENHAYENQFGSPITLRLLNEGYRACSCEHCRRPFGAEPAVHYLWEEQEDGPTGIWREAWLWQPVLKEPMDPDAEVLANMSDPFFGT